jgi:hypothetical protein
VLIWFNEFLAAAHEVQSLTKNCLSQRKATCFASLVGAIVNLHHAKGNYLNAQFDGPNSTQTVSKQLEYQDALAQVRILRRQCETIE